METKQELVTFVIPFDEVYGEVYGIPTINDLDINGYGVYDTSKWPSEIKEFVTAFASDDDVISIPGYAAWDRYNLDRAKEFVNVYQRLLGKYIDFVEVKFDKFDYGTLFATVDRFDLIKEFADKYEIAQDEIDPAKIVEAVCDFILDKENLNYDDIAKEAENTRAVKSNYTLSLQALKDEFEFEPEITDIKDLDKYSFINGKFIWTADSPDQLKLDLGLESIDKDVLTILNESDAPTFTFDDLPKEVEEFIYDDSNYSIMPEIQDFVEENEEKEFDANEVPDLMEQIRDFALSLAEKDLLDSDIYDEISNAIDKFLEENADYFIER